MRLWSRVRIIRKNCQACEEVNEKWSFRFTKKLYKCYIWWLYRLIQIWLWYFYRRVQPMAFWMMSTVVEYTLQYSVQLYIVVVSDWLQEKSSKIIVRRIKVSFDMASIAIGVSLSMTGGIGGADDVDRVATTARTTLKLNPKNSLNESTCRFSRMKSNRGCGAIRTVSKAVVDEEEMSRNLRVGLICGGPSAERGISLNSARSVLDHIQVLFFLPWSIELGSV